MALQGTGQLLKQYLAPLACQDIHNRRARLENAQLGTRFRTKRAYGVWARAGLSTESSVISGMGVAETSSTGDTKVRLQLQELEALAYTCVRTNGHSAEDSKIITEVGISTEFASKTLAGQKN